jgi:predicted dehydrogenase
MSAPALRYGVIGCGMMGQEHLRNIALLPGARVAAICEPDPSMAAIAAALAPEAVLCPDLPSLLAQEGLDCLLVASPNHCHVAQLEEIARLRPLPVMVEKPLYVSEAEAARLAALPAAMPIWVAMEYRYMPAIARFLTRLEAVTGGATMLTIREHRFPFLPKVGGWNRYNRRTGGTLVEKCCHFFDLMRLALGSDPVRIMASGGQMVNHRDETGPEGAPDIWDSAYVIVDFASGARAMLELCMYAEGSRFQEELSACGPAGRIEARVPGPARFWPPALGPLPLAEVVESPRQPPGPRLTRLGLDPALMAAGDHNGATFHQHQAFAAALRGQGPWQVGREEGAWAVRMGLAAQRAAETGQVLRFD